MPALLAQPEDENYSPPTEGTSDTLGWQTGVGPSWESFPDLEPTPVRPPRRTDVPSDGGDFRQAPQKQKTPCSSPASGWRITSRRHDQRKHGVKIQPPALFPSKSTRGTEGDSPSLKSQAGLLTLGCQRSSFTLP